MINNLGLGTFETSEETLGSLYDQTKTGFFEAAGATFKNAWNYNPTSSLFRVKEQVQAYRSSNTYLNRDELNKQYGHLSPPEYIQEKVTTTPMTPQRIQEKECTKIAGCRVNNETGEVEY